MLLTCPTVGPCIILVLAHGTTRSLGIEDLAALVDVWLGSKTGRDEGSIGQTSIWEEAAIIERDTDVRIGPWEACVPFLGATVFTRLVVLLASSANGEDTSREWDVDGIGEPRWFIAQER